ncbi:hypothetical protein GGR21_001211 [Dysgonomonas hofstadii]|uniref:Lipocalin-like domain-containing protein n=1 Tax=Dysgonomonas hofstadii TaxID=637886 RepID=A0A840CS12_9BACT|nr:hypothetical protein [Dysgonomonas hofstadii]MBB4035322.1 hypothetical protein [Dysgonomonas hofstadii]
MESKIIRLRVCLLLAVCSLSWFAIAQTTKNDIKSLQGEWVWEEASIPCNESRIHFDLINSYMKFYAEIEVKEETVLFKDEDQTKSVEYVVDGDYLAFELSSGKLFITEWAILEDKLYLEFTGNDIDDSSKETVVLLVYKRK